MQKARPIEAFKKYFLDVKPYHTKILEIIEQYSITEEISVCFEEKIFFNVDYKNNPLCKPTGWGIIWDGECGFDAVDCCDLFDCIGGYGLIYDNSDLVAEYPIISTDDSVDTVVVSGNKTFDKKLQISGVPTLNAITVLGDVTAEFNNHNLFLVVPLKTVDVDSNTDSEITLSGNFTDILLPTGKFHLYNTDTDDGIYDIHSITYDSGTNKTIIELASPTVITPNLTDAIVEFKIASRNNGVYLISSVSFNGSITTILLHGSTFANFTSATEGNNHGSIQLRTGMLSGRKIELENTLTSNDGGYEILDSEYDSVNDQTIIHLAGYLTEPASTGFVRMYGYLQEGGFDGEADCGTPKHSNVAVGFSEHLLIIYNDTAVTPTLTATPTVTPTLTATITPTLTATVTPTPTITPTPSSPVTAELGSLLYYFSGDAVATQPDAIAPWWHERSQHFGYGYNYPDENAALRYGVKVTSNVGGSPTGRNCWLTTGSAGSSAAPRLFRTHSGGQSDLGPWPGGRATAMGGNNPWSGAIWVYPTNITSLQGLMAMGNEESTFSDNHGYNICIDSDSTVRFSIANGATTTHIFNSTTTLNINSWNLVGWSHEPVSNEIGIFLNGVYETDTYSGSVPTAVNVPSAIGVRWVNNVAANALAVNSRFDGIALWSSTLDGNTFNFIYNTGNGLTPEEFFNSTTEYNWPAGGFYGPNTIGDGYQAELWLDASKDEKMYVSGAGGVALGNSANRVSTDGDPVEKWEEPIFSEQPPDSGTPSGAATYKQSIQNGLSVVRFSGSRFTTSNKIRFRRGTTHDKITIFFAGSVNTTGNIINFSISTSVIRLFGVADGRLRWYDGSVTATSTGAVGANQFFVGCAVYDAGSYKFYINNTLAGSGSGFSPSYGMYYSCYLGAKSGLGAPSVELFGGDIGELAVYGLALSETEISVINTYLMDKWGVV